jgi:hypothetical protein
MRANTTCNCDKIATRAVKINSFPKHKRNFNLGYFKNFKPKHRKNLISGMKM